MFALWLVNIDCLFRFESQIFQQFLALPVILIILRLINNERWAILIQTSGVPYCSYTIVFTNKLLWLRDGMNENQPSPKYYLID